MSQCTRKQPAEDSPGSPCNSKCTRGPVEEDFTGPFMADCNWEMQTHELQIEQHTDCIADLESKVRSQQDLLHRQSMDLEHLEAKMDMLNGQCPKMMRDAIKILET
ncbi:uncharacterized protein EDB91DRAFT_1090181 [Suillus paluster]|uniref:uncharacterized protein n=1 Tax=Suillus paluster TaxID=48578 RepID=UPI001B86A9BA|nr:uncharacterized protein EDB91DRAFT_1090181 [Suillus paluster]KAG1718257.1 hypothetical protein EDB91DRAFT_1090181 [Suillus paluster]